MKLNRLIEKCHVVAIQGDNTAEVAGITADSRRVTQDWLFVAVEGI